MTEDEIVCSYRQAKDQQAQLSVLADLNLCRVPDIVSVLERHGIVIKARKAHSSRKLDPVRAKELYDMGFDDKEISRRLGVVKSTVERWRDSLRLIPNVSCETKKERRRKPVETKNTEKGTENRKDMIGVELLRIQKILETQTAEDGEELTDLYYRLTNTILLDTVQKK